MLHRLKVVAPWVLLGIGLAVCFGTATAAFAQTTTTTAPATAITSSAPPFNPLPYVAAGGAGSGAAVGGLIWIARRFVTGDAVSVKQWEREVALFKLVEQSHEREELQTDALRQNSQVLADNAKVMRTVERRNRKP